MLWLTPARNSLLAAWQFPKLVRFVSVHGGGQGHGHEHGHDMDMDTADTETDAGTEQMRTLNEFIFFPMYI